LKNKHVDCIFSSCLYAPVMRLYLYPGAYVDGVYMQLRGCICMTTEVSGIGEWPASP